MKEFMMADVRKAKAKAVETRKTRNGLSTVDYVLSQVREGDEQHLAAAINYLRKKGTRR